MSINSASQTAASDADVASALEALQSNNKQNIQASRRHASRVDVNRPISLLPGNASDRDGTSYSGTCRDLSNQGCRLIMDRPLTVGDIYLVRLDDEQIQLDPSFARCIRCHMLREETFECGLSFLSPVTMGGDLNTADSDLDLG